MNALYAEWTKLRTLPGTIWLLAGAVLTTVAVSTLTIAAASCHAAACGQDPGRITLTGTDIGQAVVVVLAVLAIGDEYGTGIIRLSLTAVPRRLSLLAAKLAALTGLVLAASVVAVTASVIIGAAHPAGPRLHHRSRIRAGEPRGAGWPVPYDHLPDFDRGPQPGRGYGGA